MLFAKEFMKIHDISCHGMVDIYIYALNPAVYDSDVRI
jgi:hypothetical protein